MPNFKKESSTLDLLLTKCSIQYSRKGSLISSKQAFRAYGFFLMDGTVAAFQPDQEKAYLHWIGVTGDFFTATQHAYSLQRQSLHSTFLTAGKIAYIPLKQLREIADSHVSMQQYLYMQESRRADFFSLKSLILAEHASHRYAKLCLWLPQIAYKLNNKQLSSFLAIDVKTLYKSKRDFLFNSIS